jgi:hypothetical protein
MQFRNLRNAQAARPARHGRALSLIVVIALAALLGVGCPAESPETPLPVAVDVPARPPQTPFRFVDRAAEAGVSFVQTNGEEADLYTILEQLGAGVAMFDYDGDSWLDLYFPGGGQLTFPDQILPKPAALFRNVGGLSFVPATAGARLPDPAFYAHGATVGDYDQDGFGDLLVTGYGGLVLYRNRGDGTFEAANVPQPPDRTHWLTSAGWGDVTGDGNLDLYVCGYVDWDFVGHDRCSYATGSTDICSPKEYPATPDVLYVSDGAGGLVDRTIESGMGIPSKGLAVLLFDPDEDGDLDVYEANDTLANYLYVNRGQGQFAEQGHTSGVALGEFGTTDGSMGVDALDYNLDGRMDLWVANYEGDTFALYRNEGSRLFNPVSSVTGVTAVGALYVGWGTAAIDWDRDGDEDLLTTNGHVLRHPSSGLIAQQPMLMENLAPRAFLARAAFESGFMAQFHRGRGLAAGDLDQDGRIDAVITHVNDPVALLVNQTPSAGAWLAVRLVGRISNRDAIGARLVLHTSQGDRVRQVKGGGSYASHSDPKPYWGLPPGMDVTSLTVTWPSGIRQELHEVPVDRVLTLIEPERDEP